MRSLPDEMCVGVGEAMGQVHDIIIMREGKGESQGVPGGSFSPNDTTLVVGDATPYPVPACALNQQQTAQAARRCHTNRPI